MIPTSSTAGARLGIVSLALIILWIVVLAPGAAVLAQALLGDGAILLVGLAVGVWLPVFAATKLGGGR